MSDSLKDVFGADCSFAEKVGAFHAGMDAEDRTVSYTHLTLPTIYSV